MNRLLARASLGLALGYTALHFAFSGIAFPLRVPNVGQIVEELQPIHRQMLSGSATVDQGRQYGPVFLFLFDPVYRLTDRNETALAWYAYVLSLVSIGAAFWFTVVSIRIWLASRGLVLTRSMLLGLILLWGNFGPMYGVLAVKNVELWELAFIMAGCAAALSGRRWIVSWAIAAGALTKMLPLVFLPYLLLRDRRTFAYAVVALLMILTLSQLAYGTEMGLGYGHTLLRAASSGPDFGWKGGLIWHENISLRGLMMKAFGYLEQPSSWDVNNPYQRGFYTVIPPTLFPWASAAGTAAQALGVLWVAWTLFTRRGVAEPGRLYWDWALVAAMMLPLAPQASHDYMVLTLGAFSFVLIGCLVYGGRANWLAFGLATLLVANIVPRGAFGRLMLVDPMMEFAGHQHLTRAEAYQYFGFPLLGLLVLVWVWTRVARMDADTARTA